MIINHDDSMHSARLFLNKPIPPCPPQGYKPRERRAGLSHNRFILQIQLAGLGLRIYLIPFVTALRQLNE